MGIINTNKQVNVDHIDCHGTFRVTLSLTAAPDITANPTDIALVLDRSGSMRGTPLQNMKTGADTFIDIIAEATGGAGSGTIGSGSHIGVVSFADTATINAPLITSVQTLKDAVDALTAGGSTNHADAFTKAIQLFDPASSNHKVIVMFTDGKTTAGAPPAPVAAAAKAAGIVIYCIGLIGENGIDVSVLNEWASDPDSTHVAVTPDSDDLEQLFADLAADISKPGATNIVIREVLNSAFGITNISMPTKGTAMLVDSTTLRWEIAQLGVTGTESAVLEFTVQDVAQVSGLREVNHSITYSDTEGNVVSFPNPTINVDCGCVVMPEACPEPVDLAVTGCSDSLIVDMGDVDLQSQGRIVQMDVTLKHVCPGKRVALAAILSEVDEHGLEHARGTKTMTIPAHHAATCRDVLVKCIHFVLPEDLDVSGDTPHAMCNPRNLKVRFIAHNIDTDYQCCNTVTRY